ncbi:hypothetical protein PRZ48_013502 [Zasmidium cellare]|uniref:RRM domain-containing protein n=1 Tax=Zasmidium cellare TaxID=395010 RepID=A0ABR0E1K5_ZASCE|nr:hypothetical protein PRZ48_013502 [Zasmidium cellare]
MFSQSALGPPPVWRLPVTSSNPAAARAKREKTLNEHSKIVSVENYTAGDVQPPAFSREIDSGILSLETPINKDPISPTLSVASAPAAAPSSIFTRTARSSSVGSAPSTPPSTPPSTQGGPASHPRAFKARQDDFNLAQLVFPATAAVFVGNLPAHCTDDVLSGMVFHRFSRYGKVSVFIKRTIAQKPWALLQYQHFFNAQRAVKYGSRELMCGRQLRVQISQARRDILILRRNGLPASEWILKANFSQFGEVESIYGRPDVAYVIRFKCYGSYQLAKDAVRSGTTPYVLVTWV